jgi:hypothetical protein
MSMNLIERLPTEIFYQIFDNLNAETILYSIRPLSKLFRSIVNNYHRYILDFSLISKRNFYVFCRLIHPENIISLTLSNDDQIHLFVSLIHLQQLTRLRSLTLIDIHTSQLNFFLRKINFNMLISFSINISKYDDKFIETLVSILASIITQTTLQKLDFNTSSSIDYVSGDLMTSNNRLNIIDLCKILQCSSHLHTLILNEIPKGMIDNLTSKSLRQLTSLTLENLSVNIDELELFLSLTSSLIYLKLFAGRYMFNGKRWEEFIQINLPYLDRFEFYFSDLKSKKQTMKDLKLMITPFQTSFWIEHKKWFVTCEYALTKHGLHIISLYSMPICTSRMSYTSKSNRISLSTDPDNLTTMNNIKSLSLILDTSIANEIQEKVCHSLFHQVTELDLQFCNDWPLITLQSLVVFIDISRIVHIKLSSDYRNEYNETILMDMKIFFEQAQNLSALLIHTSFYRHKFDLKIEDIHAIVPRHVKQLQIPIDNLDQINQILERCEQLSTIEFDIEGIEFGNQIIKWFDDNTINTTCRHKSERIIVWIGKKRIQSTVLYSNHKRIKVLDCNF